MEGRRHFVPAKIHSIRMLQEGGLTVDLDMRELEAFAAVVEQSSFSKAAKVLFLTQPTVSSHIASLEKKLDTRLLIRTSRTVCPSDAGRLLYDYARRILDLRTQATEAIAAFSREMRGTIHIAASDPPGQYYLDRKSVV